MRSPALFLLVAIAAAGVLASCAGDRATDPLSDRACSNPLAPSTFRVIYAPTAAVVDTTPLVVNRYLVPHRNRDRIASWLPIIWEPDSYCETVLDSLVIHLPNTIDAFVP